MSIFLLINVKLVDTVFAVWDAGEVETVLF